MTGVSTFSKVISISSSCTSLGTEQKISSTGAIPVPIAVTVTGVTTRDTKDLTDVTGGFGTEHLTGVTEFGNDDRAGVTVVTKDSAVVTRFGVDGRTDMTGFGDEGFLIGVTNRGVDGWTGVTEMDVNGWTGVTGVAKGLAFTARFALNGRTDVAVVAKIVLGVARLTMDLVHTRFGNGLYWLIRYSVKASGVKAI